MVLNFLKSGYQKVRQALTKTKERITKPLFALLGHKLDEETVERLEELFLQADLGLQVTTELIEHLKESPARSEEERIEVVKQKLLSYFAKSDHTLSLEASPTALLIVGVNGNGKTTSTAKLANRLQAEGRTVLLGAADTFRAAAVEQLTLWADKIGAPLVSSQPGADPAAVAFDTLSAAKARGVDVALIDTAGRLQTKKDLMQELAKIRRACSKALPGAPHETLLVIDATTGQNAIDQAKVFHEHLPLTGIILTKLDASGRGGVIVRLMRELQIPVKFIGTGEGEEDLLPFTPEEFVTALFS